MDLAGGGVVVECKMLASKAAVDQLARYVAELTAADGFALWTCTRRASGTPALERVA